MKEKTKIQLPKELQGEIIVVAHCCCAGHTKKTSKDNKNGLC